MSALGKEIEKDLLELPAEVRGELAHSLIRSLDTEVDEDADALWAREIDKRCREIAEGKVKCRPIAEVLADIRRKLDRASSQPS